MRIEILGCESLGARSLCCKVYAANRIFLIDPGVALGCQRLGYPPHPLELAAGQRMHKRIHRAMEEATDVVLSHFHGDHVPLLKPVPPQISIEEVSPRLRRLRIWSLGANAIPEHMAQRRRNIELSLDRNLRDSQSTRDTVIRCSSPQPHGSPGTPLGSVMMTLFCEGNERFAHASDVQLLDDEAVEQLLSWEPQTVLVSGPPLYLDRLPQAQLYEARRRAIRLGNAVETLIMDHHLLRSISGRDWQLALREKTSCQLLSGAEYMGKPNTLLEAHRKALYNKHPIPRDWMETKESRTRWLSVFMADS